MIMIPLPPVIGHRGAAALAPENTLASFRQAAGLGCRMVEFDVRLSADGVAVVVHDDTLERTSDGAGPVGAQSLAELKRLDAGRWFGPAFAGERIPTLAEVLALCRDAAMAVNIEIKPDAGAERATALAAVAVARSSWPAHLPPPFLSSFSRPALAAAAEAAPDWPRGLLVEELPADWRQSVEALGCVSVGADHRRLSVAEVAELHAHGLAVLAWTVDSPARAARLWGWGVDAVFTNAPDRVVSSQMIW